MNRYMRFDVEAFLKDSASGKWKEEIKTLEEEKKNLLILKAQGNSEVHSGNISHPTEDIGIKYAEIEEKIDRLSRYPYLLAEAMDNLTADEETLIRGFYFGKKSINYFVDAYSAEHGCQKSTVYTRKREAVETLRRLLCKEYNNA